LAVPRRGASAALYAGFEFWSGLGKAICKGSAAGARGVGHSLPVARKVTPVSAVSWGKNFWASGDWVVVIQV
jgi:hypothetical protein